MSLLLEKMSFVATILHNATIKNTNVATIKCIKNMGVLMTMTMPVFFRKCFKTTG